MLGIEFINHRIIEAVEKANREFHHANLEIYNLWVSDMVFEWHWWVNLGLSILPWLLWIRFRKKDSTHRLLYAGFVPILRIFNKRLPFMEIRPSPLKKYLYCNSS